jgi:putative endonuclease
VGLSRECHSEPKAKNLLPRWVAKAQPLAEPITSTSWVTTLYTGVTNDLSRRVYEHKSHLVPGFTSGYSLDRLVYFEETNGVDAAIAREKQIKGWVRAKKLALVRSSNPQWKDLSADWYS